MVQHFIAQLMIIAKRLTILPLTILHLLGCLTLCRTEGLATEPQVLRVLCYNIHHGRGVDDQVDLQRIARVIRDAQPDLVALQEVDNRTQRTGGVDQTAELARLCEMHGQFVKQIDYEGGEYGQAILARVPLRSLQIYWLPGQPERERRILGMAELELFSQPLLFCTTHLHHINGEFRTQQAAEINKILAVKGDSLAILAGDLNAEPKSAPIATLSEQWTVASAENPLLTFPAQAPIKQIDYIAYRPASALKLVRIEVIAEPIASDHRPLLAVFELNITRARPIQD